jgi:hypothetical protein
VKHNWYCGVEGQQYGPYTWEQLRAMAAEGRIISDSFVRRDVDQQWFQAAQVPGLLPKVHAGPKKNGAASSAIGNAVAVGQDASKSSTSIKRPKAVTSHSSGNIPVGSVPASSVPVGQAVAAGPSAAPAGIAMNPPAAPAFAFSAAPAPTASQHGEPPAQVKKGASPFLIVGILGGAVALVGLLGIGIVIWSLTRAVQTTGDQVAAALDQDMQEALEQMASEIEGNPQAFDGNLAQPADRITAPFADQMQQALSESAASAPAGSAPASSAAAPASAAEAAKVLKSVSRWTDASQLRGVELNKLKLSLGPIWLASDEAGTKTEPTASGAKYVFVQVQVKNIAPVPRKFKSWNATAGTSVVLADQKDAVLSLVPASSTPAAGRLATVDILPGQSVTDTLVFTAPSGSIEKLKLALAKSALAENARFKTGSHFALEIPLEVLLASGSPEGAAHVAEEPIAANRAAPAAPGEQPPIIAPQPVPEAGDPPVPAPMPPPKKEDRPPTREELNKQFEELSKTEGQPEPKKGEAQK